MANVSNILYNGTTYGIEGVTDQTLSISGLAADAAAVGAALARGSMLTEEAKQALLACFAQVAWIGDDGQDYYDALEAALYPPTNLVSISAVYTQSGTVYDTDTLDSLKPDLVVTAHYDDSTTAVITGYTLSGTLTEGTSTITVSYSGKTTTFNVTVTFGWTLEWDYTDGGLPTTVAPNDWQASQDSSNYNTITFDNNNGIKWVGSAGGYTIQPKNYLHTENGIMEIVVRFETYNQYMNVRATLNTASDTLIGFLFKDGVKVNGSGTGYNFISNTAVELNTDHTLRVERASNIGKVYLDGVEVYSGALRALSGTNNVLISPSQNTTSSTLYVKAIRFRHIS